MNKVRTELADRLARWRSAFALAAVLAYALAPAPDLAASAGTLSTSAGGSSTASSGGANVGGGPTATVAHTLRAARAASAAARERVAAEQAAAARIAADIQAKGVLLAKLAERADAEGVSSAALATRLRLLALAQRSTTAQLQAARQLLIDEAVTAYTDGGVLALSPPSGGTTPPYVVAVYAEAAARYQLSALGRYESAMAANRSLEEAVARQQEATVEARKQLAIDGAAAAAEQASLRQTLAGVRGQLAVAVAEAQQQQMAAEEAEERALLASTGQLPASPPTSPTTTAAAVSSTTPSSAPSSTTALALLAPRTPSTASATTAVPTRAGSSSTPAAPPSTLPLTTSAPTSGSNAIATAARTPITADVAVSATTTNTSSATTANTSSATTTMTTPATTTVTTSAATTDATTATSPGAATTSTAESQLGAGAGSTSGATASSSSSTTQVPSAATAPSSTTTTLYPPVGTGASTVTSGVPLGAGSQPTSSANVPAAGWQVAVAFAESQVGKPYQWAGAGPSAYDCSGLTMASWEKAGVTLPHSAQDQYDLTTRVEIGDLLLGDLVFFGTPTDVYHVGIYIGNGQMVDAPETGEDVKIQSIYELSLLGGGRVP